MDFGPHRGDAIPLGLVDFRWKGAELWRFFVFFLDTVDGRNPAPPGGPPAPPDPPAPRASDPGAPPQSLKICKILAIAKN